MELEQEKEDKTYYRKRYNRSFIPFITERNNFGQLYLPEGEDASTISIPRKKPIKNTTEQNVRQTEKKAWRKI